MAAEAAALADLLKDDLDDDFVYEEVEVMRCDSPYSSLSCHSHAVLTLDSDDGDNDAASEDLDAALRSLQAFTNKASSCTDSTIS
jgi:hypothetical protein